MKTKVCNKCNKRKSINKFGKVSKAKDGLSGTCKICKNIEAKIWRENNKESVKRSKLKWNNKNPNYESERYLKNKEHILKITKEYRKNNPEKRKELARNWQRNNPDKVNAAGAKWRKNNPEKAKKSCDNWAKNNPEKMAAKSRRRRAKKKSIQENYSAEDAQITKQAFGNKCAKCGTKNKITIDHHMPLNDGHALTLSNAVLLCKSCNSSKWTKLPVDFYSPKELSRIEKILSRFIDH